MVASRRQTIGWGLLSELSSSKVRLLMMVAESSVPTGPLCLAQRVGTLYLTHHVAHQTSRRARATDLWLHRPLVTPRLHA